MMVWVEVAGEARVINGTRTMVEETLYGWRQQYGEDAVLVVQTVEHPTSRAKRCPECEDSPHPCTWHRARAAPGRPPPG